MEKRNGASFCVHWHILWLLAFFQCSLFCPFHLLSLFPMRGWDFSCCRIVLDQGSRRRWLNGTCRFGVLWSLLGSGHTVSREVCCDRSRWFCGVSAPGRAIPLLFLPTPVQFHVCFCLVVFSFPFSMEPCWLNSCWFWCPIHIFGLWGAASAAPVL